MVKELMLFKLRHCIFKTAVKVIFNINLYD